MVEGSLKINFQNWSTSGGIESIDLKNKPDLTMLTGFIDISFYFT